MNTGFPFLQHVYGGKREQSEDKKKMKWNKLYLFFHLPCLDKSKAYSCCCGLFFFNFYFIFIYLLFLCKSDPNIALGEQLYLLSNLAENKLKYKNLQRQTSYIALPLSPVTSILLCWCFSNLRDLILLKAESILIRDINLFEIF